MKDNKILNCTDASLLYTPWNQRRKVFANNRPLPGCDSYQTEAERARAGERKGRERGEGRERLAWLGM